MDRKIIWLGILLIIIFEYQYIYSPDKRSAKNLDILILKKEKEFNEFLELCEKYKKTEEKKKNAEDIKFVSEKFSIFSFLNDLIIKNNLKTNVSDIKILPFEKINNFIIEKIQIQINYLKLEQLLFLLEEIEKTNGVYINEFKMERDKEKPYFLNTSIIIGCLKIVKETKSE